MIAFFRGANEAVMKMVHLVMIFAPIGIFGLVAANIARNGGGAEFLGELSRLGWYVAVVAAGGLLAASRLFEVGHPGQDPCPGNVSNLVMPLTWA